MTWSLLRYVRRKNAISLLSSNVGPSVAVRGHRLDTQTHILFVSKRHDPKSPDQNCDVSLTCRGNRRKHRCRWGKQKQRCAPRSRGSDAQQHPYPSPQQAPPIPEQQSPPGTVQYSSTAPSPSPCSSAGRDEEEDAAAASKRWWWRWWRWSLLLPPLLSSLRKRARRDTTPPASLLFLWLSTPLLPPLKKLLMAPPPPPLSPVPLRRRPPTPVPLPAPAKPARRGRGGVSEAPEKRTKKERVEQQHGPAKVGGAEAKVIIGAFPCTSIFHHWGSGRAVNARCPVKSNAYQATHTPGTAASQRTTYRTYENTPSKISADDTGPSFSSSRCISPPSAVLTLTRLPCGRCCCCLRRCWFSLSSTSLGRPTGPKR